MRTAIAHLYIPLFTNDGRPVDALELAHLRGDIIARLGDITARLGGLTVRLGGLTTWAAMGYADGYPTEPIQVWEVIGDAELVPYLVVLAQRIKRVLHQDNVLISVTYGDVIRA